MSDLDDLAAAARGEQYLPQRYAPMQGGLGASRVRPATYARTDAPPLVITVPVPVITNAHRQPQHSAFGAGFFGTFGVVAALVVMVLGAVIVCIILAAVGEASRRAEQQTVVSTPTVEPRASVLTPHRSIFDEPQAAPPRAVTPTPRPHLPPREPKRSDPVTVQDAVRMSVGRVDSSHVRLTGRNNSARNIQGADLDVYGDDDLIPLYTVTVEKFPAGSSVDRVIEVSGLADGAKKRLRVSVSAGRFE